MTRTRGEARMTKAKEMLELAEAGMRHGNGLAAQLAKPDWKPGRAHIEQARNTIYKLSAMLRLAAQADAPGGGPSVEIESIAIITDDPSAHFFPVTADSSASVPQSPKQSFDPIRTYSGNYDFDAIDDLVDRFSEAIREKLRASEIKYGHNSGWMRDDWQADCQRSLNEHLAKGDPRDVAAYCAFLWHHAWLTVGPLTPEDVKHVAALTGSRPDREGK